MVEEGKGGGEEENCYDCLNETIACLGNEVEYCCGRQLLHVKTVDSYNVILEYCIYLYNNAK